MNFTNVANDAQVKRTTVYEYFEILKDTLIVMSCRRGKRRKKESLLLLRSIIFLTWAWSHHSRAGDFAQELRSSAKP